MEYYWWKGDKNRNCGFSYSSSLRIFQYTNYFAVITAIVTIEPTATDSIKRTSSFSSFNNWISVCNDFHIFPRSSGAFLCVSGNVYNRYMSKTKATRRNVSRNFNCCCNDSHYGRSLFYCILIRLATTSTGIIVSTLVNFSSYHHTMLKQFRDVQKSYLLKRQMLWRNGLLR